jgi:hypothetical protein
MYLEPADLKPIKAPGGSLAWPVAPDFVPALPGAAEPRTPALSAPAGSRARADAAARILSFFAAGKQQLAAAPPLDAPALPASPRSSGSGSAPQSNLNPTFPRALLAPARALLCLLAAKYAPAGLLERWGIFRVLDRVIVPRGPLFCTPCRYSSAFSFSRTPFLWALRHHLDGALTALVLLYMFLVQPLFVALQLWAVPLPDTAYRALLFWSRAVRSVHSAPLDTGPAFLVAGFWMCLWAFLAILFYQLSTQHRTRALGIGGHEFPSVAHLLFQSRAPFLMVSYAWGSDSGLAGARSLAHALPGSWVDVANLGGRDLDATIARNAATAYALVAYLDASYLKSAACALELQAAVLHRHSSRQLSYVLHDGASAPAALLQALQAAGFTLLSSPQALLRELSQHAYTCAAPEDSARLLRHMRQHATPSAAWDRTLLLPSPAVAAQRRACCTHLLPPAGSVTAGSAFLSPDGLRLGVFFWGVTVDSVLTAFYIASCACLCVGTGFLWARGSDLDACIVFTCFTLAALALPLVFRDFMMTRRCLHSPHLLALNAASYCSAVAALRVVFVLGSEAGLEAGADLAALAPRAEDLVPGLAARFKNIAGFIEAHVGLATEQARWTRAGTDRDAASGNALAVFLIEDAAAALAYLRLPRHENSVVVTYLSLLGVRGAEGQSLGSTKCILLGSKNGVAPSTPYDGLAPAVLDSLSSLVSSALLEAPPEAAPTPSVPA